jgi:hypothetical protein
MKYYLLIVAMLIVGMLALVVAQKYRQEAFHEGYERGALQTAWYIHHTQPETRGIVRYPSQAWRNCAWHFVDQSENSGFIEICEHEGGPEKEKR